MANRSPDDDYGYDDSRHETVPRRGRSRTRRPLTGESDRMLEPDSDAYYGDENLRRRGNSLPQRKRRSKGGNGKMPTRQVRRGPVASSSRLRDHHSTTRGRKKKPGVFYQRGRSKENVRMNRSKRVPARSRSTSRSRSRSVTRTSKKVVDRFGGGGFSHSRSTGFGSKKKSSQQSLRMKYGAGGSGARAVRSLQKMHMRGKGRRAW